MCRKLFDDLFSEIDFTANFVNWNLVNQISFFLGKSNLLNLVNQMTSHMEDYVLSDTEIFALSHGLSFGRLESKSKIENEQLLFKSNLLGCFFETKILLYFFSFKKLEGHGRCAPLLATSIIASVIFCKKVKTFAKIQTLLQIQT